MFSLGIEPEAHEGFLRLLFDIGQYKKIIQLYPKLKTLFQKNIDIQLIFAKSLFIVNATQKAEQIFSQLAQDYPFSMEAAYIPRYVTSKTINAACAPR